MLQVGDAGTARKLIGRASELAELRTALAATIAVNGQGRACLIGGEPGIGKTRLCDSIASEATARGVRVLWGRCWEAGGAPPYWPWLEALRALCGELDDASLRGALGDGATACFELLPELRDRLGGGSAVVGTQLKSGDEARFTLYRAVLGLLRASARAKPALIVIDDLHAADDASLQLLRFVAREARSLQLLLIATYREIDARWTDSGRRVLSQIAREAETLSLGPLAQHEAEALLDAQSGGLEPELRARLAARAQGNPLFLEELLRSLTRDESGEALPRGVRELIRERLARVSADVRGVLDLAAAAGDAIDAELLAEAAGLPSSAIDEALQAASDAGIVRAEGRRIFRFAHALIREVLETDLAPGAGARLHAQVARAIAARPDAERLDAELSHHWLIAHDPVAAVFHATRAADRAIALFAYDEAIALLERTLATLGARDALTAQTEIALARAHMRRGSYHEGRMLCARAGAIARELGNAELLAQAALARGMDITAALIDPELVAMLQSALEGLPDGDSALRVQVTARLAAAMQPHPDLMYPIGLARSAIASARRLGNDATLLGALYNGMATMMDIVDPKERIPLNLEVEKLATEAGDHERLLRTQGRLAFDHLELGELAEADARIQAFERIATEAGARRYLWRAPLFRSLRATMHGHFEEAEVMIERARVLGHAAGDPHTDRTCVLHFEGLLRAAERHEQMIALDPEARRVRAALYSGAHWQNGGSAFTYSRIEDAASAERYLSLVPQDDWPIVHNPPAFAHLGEPLAMCGAQRAVEHVYALLAPAKHRFLSWGYTAFAWDGPASRVLGLLALRLSRWDDAETFFAHALCELERLDAGPYLARTSYEHGRSLIDREPARARAAIERARTLAEQLGMPGLVRLCDARLKAFSRPQAPASVRAPATPVNSRVLLQSEGEVWSIQMLDGETLRVRDSLGMQYLARLIASPGQAIHALELAQTRGTDAALTSVMHSSDAGEELDATARAQYRARANALREDIEAAETAGDAEKAEHARSELTFLAGELSRAVGLSGRSRRAGSAAERARTAVQRRIKSAFDRIRELSPELADLLESTVRTGTYCEYRPELEGRK